MGRVAFIHYTPKRENVSLIFRWMGMKVVIRIRERGRGACKNRAEGCFGG